MAALLNERDIRSQLNPHPHWTLQGNTIQQVKTFDGFPSAIAVVNALVDPAEAAGHHPDITISYNRVTITHDAGGLTAKDFALAAEINQLV